MKKLLPFSLALIPLNLNAQIIKCRVLEVETDSVVSFAHVYFNASNEGTATDIDGYFKIERGENSGLC